MKVKVNRLLSAGRYNVNFEVSDFTPDEVGKMASFGVPMIELKTLTANGLSAVRVPVNQISKNINAMFISEEVAEEYVKKVLDQIRAELQRIRDSKDEFSSSNEVDV